MTDTNPTASAFGASQMPADEVIIDAIKEILIGDPRSYIEKNVKNLLQEKFGCDLMDKKSLIGQTIHKLLSVTVKDHGGEESDASDTDSEPAKKKLKKKSAEGAFGQLPTPASKHGICSLASIPFDVQLMEELRNGRSRVEGNIADGYVKYTLMKEGIPWLYQSEPSEPLVARRSTMELYDKIQEIWMQEPTESILITGNPGIGKTWFQNYFLLKWIPTMKDEDILILHSIHEQSISILRKGAPLIIASDKEAKRIIRMPNVTYLADTGGMGANEPWGCGGRTILTSSPAERHYKGFLASKKPLILYYAPWSLEELLAAKPAKMSDELVEERFNLVGGIPRHVFASDQHFELHWQKVQAAIQQIDWAMPYKWDAGDQTALSHCIFVHWPCRGYTRFTTNIASPAIEEKVKEHLIFAAPAAARSLMKAARDNPNLGSFWGLAYEAVFFSHLNEMKDKAFCLALKPLSACAGPTSLLSEEYDHLANRKGEDSKVSSSSDQEARSVSPAPHMLQVKIEEFLTTKNMALKHLTSGGCFPKGKVIRPQSKSFPTIDGLILSGTTVYSVQLTKMKQHTVNPKGLAMLKAFKEYKYERVVLVMVHPKDVAFHLPPQARESLSSADYKDIEVYEAEWEPL